MENLLADNKLTTLLVNPGYGFVKGGVWDSISSVMPPLGLAWLAAMLEKHNFPVMIKDFRAESEGYEQDLDFVKDFSSNVIGISATTPQINTALAMAKAIKETNPERLVVLGGVHPTVMPEEVLSSGYVDIVIRGEGEYTLLDVVSGKQLAEIAGISYIAGRGGIIHNADRDIIEDIDELPDPAYHLLPVNKYFPAVGSFKKLPAISILTSRGCPGRCTYCHRQLGKKTRSRSGKRIADEVKRLHDNYGINEICFYDDTFTTNHEVVYSFIEELKNHGLSMSWVCFSRVDSVDYPLLKAMAESGCHQILFGVESANKTILRNIRKGISLDRVEKAVKDAQKAGIEVRASFMLGNPGETVETIKETIAFANKLNPDVVIYNTTTPYPGTEMFEWADENGFLLTKDWDKYDLKNPVMELPTISTDELAKWYSYAYRRFYWRPGYLLKRLFKLRSKNDVLNALRGFKSIIDIVWK